MPALNLGPLTSINESHRNLLIANNITQPRAFAHICQFLYARDEFVFKYSEEKNMFYVALIDPDVTDYFTIQLCMLNEMMVVNFVECKDTSSFRLMCIIRIFPSDIGTPLDATEQPGQHSPEYKDEHPKYRTALRYGSDTPLNIQAIINNALMVINRDDESEYRQSIHKLASVAMCHPHMLVGVQIGHLIPSWLQHQDPAIRLFTVNLLYGMGDKANSVYDLQGISKTDLAMTADMLKLIVLGDFEF